MEGKETSREYLFFFFFVTFFFGSCPLGRNFTNPCKRPISGNFSASSHRQIITSISSTSVSVSFNTHNIHCCLHCARTCSNAQFRPCPSRRRRVHLHFKQLLILAEMSYLITPTFIPPDFLKMLPNLRFQIGINQRGLVIVYQLGLGIV